jgi:hypothetical protein
MESTLPALESAFERLGTGAMRHHAIALAPFVLATYEALPDSVRNAPIAYDYDIVPAILATLQWDDSGPIRPPVSDAARDVAESLDHLVNMAPTPIRPAVFTRAGDVLKRADGFHVVIDSATGETDGPFSEAEARDHSDSFGD